MGLVRALVYSNLFVAALLMLLTISSYSMLEGMQFHWYVPVSVFLGSFVLYSFHRLYKIDFIPRTQLSERHLWILKRANVMKYAMSLAVFIMMIILPNFNADTIVWLVPAGIVSVGYTIPILPTRQGWSRFRDIPLTKPLIIALVVTYLTFGFPVFEQFGIQALFEQGVLHGFVSRMLFLLAVTIPFDLRDIVNDKDAGIETIGTHYGFIRGRQLALIVLIAWGVLIGLRLFRFEMSFLEIMLPASAGVLAVGALLWMRPSWTDLRYAIVFEGLIIVYALTYLFGDLAHMLAPIQP